MLSGNIRNFYGERKVTLLLNEQKSKGGYSVNFNTKNFGAEVYFLLTAGRQFYLNKKDDFDEIFSLFF